jgi:Cu/Ag efflux pump CusA
VKLTVAVSPGATPSLSQVTAMVGGMVSATILTLVIIPSLYLIVNGWRLPKA